MSRVVVVGAGIAGLTAAYRLSARHDVTVYEREPRAGGKIHTQFIDGFVFEWGPNGFLSGATDLRELISELGLDDAVVAASPAAAKRFIFWRGTLHELPTSPPRLLSMSLLSPRGKLRALGELWVRRAADGMDDESVSQFIERRFGREVAERIVAPALLGISGGDAGATSAAAAFPRLGDLERDHGSVIRGMLRARAKPGRLTGFGAAGMQQLIDRLAQRLQGSLRLGAAVERLSPLGSGWRVHATSGEVEADRVIVATPADAAAGLIAPWDAELAEHVRRIVYAPMRVAGVAFCAQDVRVPLDGFGFLAARDQGVRILGALYTSTIFPAQAPAGIVYLRVFLGGATDAEAARLDADDVRAIVRDDLATTLGITAAPVAFHEVLWPDAIPQYAIGHARLVREIDARAARHAGFALTGNAYHGLGLGDTVRNACASAAAWIDSDAGRSA